MTTLGGIIELSSAISRSQLRRQQLEAAENRRKHAREVVQQAQDQEIKFRHESNEQLQQRMVNYTYVERNRRDQNANQLRSRLEEHRMRVSLLQQRRELQEFDRSQKLGEHMEKLNGIMQEHRKLRLEQSHKLLMKKLRDVSPLPALPQRSSSSMAHGTENARKEPSEIYRTESPGKRDTSSPPSSWWVSPPGTAANIPNDFGLDVHLEGQGLSPISRQSRQSNRRSLSQL
eukprot:TRINITY_DN3988_c0_g1_i1.p1 TRINITY_DN3988_c0_g1~~TRINITY_DN3988_c0_g1_i1.p1  ORF type:complete len:246 (-),score=32.78 TRINITY_DN3988_c0_g1_i1:74-766(-)